MRTLAKASWPGTWSTKKYVAEYREAVKILRESDQNLWRNAHPIEQDDL